MTKRSYKFPPGEFTTTRFLEFNNVVVSPTNLWHAKRALREAGYDCTEYPAFATFPNGYAIRQAKTRLWRKKRADNQNGDV